MLAVGNVLRENENPSRQPVEILPRANLPSEPCGAALAIPTVFIGSQRFSRKSAPVNLLPPFRKAREDFVMRTPQYLRTVKRIIRAPALANLEIAHVTVEHRYCGRYMFNEDFQQFLPRLQ